MKKIEVVAAAILSASHDQLFIAKRHDDSHQGGLWEFPGGKKEAGETPEQALSRELKEELGIRLQRSFPLIKLQHDYGDKIVELDVYVVDAFEGNAHGAEGQKTQWIDIGNIDQYVFPEANVPIIKALKAFLKH